MPDGVGGGGVGAGVGKLGFWLSNSMSSVVMLSKGVNSDLQLWLVTSEEAIFSWSKWISDTRAV